MSNKRKIKTPPLLIRPEYRRMSANLTFAEKGEVYSALEDYRFDGVIPELPEKLMGVFIVLKAFADEDEDSYRAVCEANSENAKKRWADEKNK